ncbi:uncharacterized protein LOC120294756 [Eucalyptus grandis]|uniref:uncharacterized protein LOC120294756 n=1 Tax=Eucalyptus grandis TaxID=71139 RepID=UPI00192EDE0F|nr:uncharacterized protein LOC120294756 [Eucalyptus grandis]
MVWRKEHLDLILVPSGLSIMLGYHLFLLYRCLRCPQTTVIGYENHYRLAWVERMLQTEAPNRNIPLSVISSAITASTSLASISLALSSLIGAWFASSSNDVLTIPFVYGDTRPTIISIKYISLLICFMLAFASFVQCVQCLVHSNFLISMPNSDVPVKYVRREVILGGVFWCLGLRAIYFAITLLLWIFGPIPMFVSSITMVMMMHFLDTNSTPLHQFQPACLL